MGGLKPLNFHQILNKKYKMSRSAYIETPSSVGIVTLSEAKVHLRVDQSEDDAYITSLILASQEVIENYCNIKVMQVTVVQYCDTWRESQELLMSPVTNSGKATITHVKYYNDAPTPVLITWPTSNYIFDKYSSPLRLALADIDTLDAYPDIATQINAIEIKYNVGYSSSADVPLSLKQACLILVGQWYENRQVDVVGRSVGKISMSAKYLMNRYKIQTLGLN